MAKNNETKTRSVTGEAVKQTVETGGVVSESTTALIAQTKDAAKMERVLADENASRLLFGTMSTFVQIDMGMEKGMRAMGAICYNLVKLPEETFRKAVSKLAAEQGLPQEILAKALKPETKPRKALELVLFARYPHMLKLQGKNKDTLAGMRLTSYMSAYKLTLPASASGPSEPTGPQELSKPRTGKELWEKLWNAGSVAFRKEL